MNRTAITCTSIVTLGFVAAAGLVAGPLNPPAGPVAATYKTLNEIEPGIPLSAANTPGDADSFYKITQPGRYYLTGGIAGVAGKHGVKINSDGVTLDLRGFELLGAAGTLDGVRIVPGFRGVTVRDGTIRGWKGAGLSAVGGPNADGCLVESLRLVGNGTDENSYALDLGGGTSAINCVAVYNLGTGIRGNNGTLISNCAASGNGGDGIICGAGTVRDCLARGNAFDGIRVGTASVVSGCSSTANLGAGVTVHHGASAVNNACFSNGWGVYVYGAGSRVEANTVYQNTVGIEVTDPGNFIIRNAFHDNTTTDLIAAGNDVGPFELAATGSSPWGNLKQ